MHLEEFLDTEEDTTQHRGGIGTGQLADVAIGGQVDIQLRPVATHQVRKQQSQVLVVVA